MSVVHKNLTGADLHEPKGADTAVSGQVYVSDGAGSGVWTAASSVITNTAWVTGNIRLTLATTASSGWILGVAGSVGDGSSGATIRANSDTSALFTLLWTNFSNALCPVSTGRGISAAADFAAHKTITLPDMWQRAIGVAGAYNASGQTTRTLGAIAGAENQTLSTANMPPYTPSGTVSTVAGNANDSILVNGNAANSVPGTGTGAFGWANAPTLKTLQSSIGSIGSSFSGSPQGGTSSAFSIMQPTVFINIEIKL